MTGEVSVTFGDFTPKPVSVEVTTVVVKYCIYTNTFTIFLTGETRVGIPGVAGEGVRTPKREPAEGQLKFCGTLDGVQTAGKCDLFAGKRQPVDAASKVSYCYN